MFEHHSSIKCLGHVSIPPTLGCYLSHGGNGDNGFTPLAVNVPPHNQCSRPLTVEHCVNPANYSPILHNLDIPMANHMISKN